MSADRTVHLSLDEVRTLALDILAARGLSAAQSSAVAETIVAGERDGCGSHGVYRLLVAAHSVSTGAVVPDAEPVLIERAPAIAEVDGRGGFAQLAFETGLGRLVEMARAQGLAALVLRDVVHFAALWPEIEAVTAHGLVALAMTPSHAWVAPEGGTQPLFGTNPIAFGWPRPGREPYVFDFATSAVARGEIELHRREGRAVPDGWGYDPNGQPTNNAGELLAGAMRTFGGHKGSALATMVELLAGPLIGGLTSARSLAADAGRQASPQGAELILAFDPAKFPGGAMADSFADAEAVFDAIEAQGARLPSARRYAAREKSLRDGVDIPAALYEDILALRR